METTHHSWKTAKRLFHAACHWFTRHYWIRPDLPGETPAGIGSSRFGGSHVTAAHARGHSDNRHGDYHA